MAGGCKLGCHSSKVVCGGGGAFKLAGYQATLPGLQQAQRSEGPSYTGITHGPLQYNACDKVCKVFLNAVSINLLFKLKQIALSFTLVLSPIIYCGLHCN